MGAHEATTTQAAYPWRAMARTAVEVGIPAFVGLLVIAPQVIEAVLAGMGEQLPPGLHAWLAGAALTITAASATLARIAAIPGVIAWTRRFLPFLAPDNKTP